MQGESHGRKGGKAPWRTLALLTLFATSAQGAVLPLERGTFVLTGVPCRNAALAALFTYDGRQFSYPHASACRSVMISRTGRIYQLRETCAALGDGTPAAPVTTVSSYRITSPTHVWISNRNGRANASYRWCRSR